MGYETLIVDQTGAIATITLNRPEARNALDFAMRRELLTALDEIEASPTARVVILTGAGGHFCAGGDVKTMRTRHTAAEGRGGSSSWSSPGPGAHAATRSAARVWSMSTGGASEIRCWAAPARCRS